MARKERQKLKLLILRDLLQNQTDEAHGLTVQEMIDALAAQEISAERKSIYSDLNALEEYGLDLVHTRDRTVRYSLAHRIFELPELKLLVDAVQSSRFLSERKSRALIHKIEGLASRFEAQALQRQVYVAGRVKSMNESVYYNIDALHTAIATDRQITFRYFSWGVGKERVFHHGGALYQVSPYALMREEENYYVVGFDEASASVRHYRVDKMDGITLTQTARGGKEAFANFDIAQYAGSHPGMYGGATQNIELVCANRLANVILDKFGRDVTLWPVDDAHFKVCCKTTASPPFLGWVAGFGAEAKIVSPPQVADAFAKMCLDAAAQYHL